MTTYEIPSADETLKYMIELGELTYIPENSDYFQTLAIIKKYYIAMNERIIDFNKIRPNCIYNPYPFDWMKLLNHVEFAAWSIMRCKGRICMYPQYPVLNYYLDFGNPLKKLGIEIDGKEWHNIEKDTIRDTRLLKEGWTIIRITGAEINKSVYNDSFDNYEYNEQQTMSDIKHWILNTGDGIIEAVKHIYFEPNPFVPEDISVWFRGICQESILRHTLIDQY